ncbi:MAG: hypothetical protein GY804_14100 [Alphaproteobacteria bacterium]|nr:hypothetical protein [Alphaproteobacteria bacterium]
MSFIGRVSGFTFFALATVSFLPSSPSFANNIEPSAYMHEFDVDEYKDKKETETPEAFYKRIDVEKSDVTMADVAAMPGIPYSAAGSIQQKVMDTLSSVITAMFQTDMATTVSFPFEMRMENASGVYKMYIPKVVIQKKSSMASILNLQINIKSQSGNTYKIDALWKDIFLQIRKNYSDGSSELMYGVIKSSSGYKFIGIWNKDVQLMQDVKISAKDIKFDTQGNAFDLTIDSVYANKGYTLRDDGAFDFEQHGKFDDINVRIHDKNENIRIKIEQAKTKAMIKKLDIVDINRFKDDVQKQIPFIMMALGTGMDVLANMAPINFPNMPKKTTGYASIRDVSIFVADKKTFNLKLFEFDAPWDDLDQEGGSASLKMKMAAKDLKIFSDDPSLAIIPKDAEFNFAFKKVPLIELYNYVEAQILPQLDGYVKFQQSLQGVQDKAQAQAQMSDYLNSLSMGLKKDVLAMLKNATTYIELEDLGIYAYNKDYDTKLTGKYNFVNDKGDFELLVRGLDFLAEYSAEPNDCDDAVGFVESDGTTISCEQVAIQNKQAFYSNINPYREKAEKRVGKDGETREVFKIKFSVFGDLYINGIKTEPHL